ncbi:MAG: cupredoxin domain-containing protein [bacterium]|nr:cupredoxin domain-containing protein [bacterium]
MKYSFVPLLAAAALLGAGCASSVPPTATDNSPKAVAPVVEQANVAPTPAPAAKTAPAPKPTTAPKAVAPAPVPTPPASTTYVVHIKDNHFVPQVLAIKAGDTVMWYNDDVSNHTSVADIGNIWDSSNISQYTSYKRVFASPGSYPYHCGAHTGMLGTIVVK